MLQNIDIFIDIFLVQLMTFQVEKPANIDQHYIMLSFKSLHFSVVWYVSKHESTFIKATNALLS